MIRRLMRTLPNYLVVVALYFLVPGFGEKTILPPLWKFLTFTVNFGLTTGVAFSHVWSLCIEEQFYLALPLLAIFVYYKKSIKLAWFLVISAIIGGVLLRACLWLKYVNCPIWVNPDSCTLFNYKGFYTHIYYFTFTRLDPIIFGVIIAIIRNFYSTLWYQLIRFGNVFLFLGSIITGINFYIFSYYEDSFMQTVIGYPLLGLGFSLLVMSALSPNSLLHKTHIIGAEKLAILSFAIYLIQKPLDHVTSSILTQYGLIARTSSLMFVCTVCISLVGGHILYTFVEMPFLKLRDKFY